MQFTRAVIIVATVYKPGSVEGWKNLHSSIQGTSDTKICHLSKGNTIKPPILCLRLESATPLDSYGSSEGL